MRKRAWAKEVFVEALMAALAEGIVSAIGWAIRKARKWWKQRQRKSGGE